MSKTHQGPAVAAAGLGEPTANDFPFIATDGTEEKTDAHV